MYVAPGFCPPNLLLAGAIIYEWECVSGQVAIKDSELVLLLGSLIDGARGEMEGILVRSFRDTAMEFGD